MSKYINDNFPLKQMYFKGVEGYDCGESRYVVFDPYDSSDQDSDLIWDSEDQRYISAPYDNDFNYNEPDVYIRKGSYSNILHGTYNQETLIGYSDLGDTEICRAYFSLKEVSRGDFLVFISGIRDGCPCFSDLLRKMNGIDEPLFDDEAYEIPRKEWDRWKSKCATTIQQSKLYKKISGGLQKILIDMVTTIVNPTRDVDYRLPSDNITTTLILTDYIPNDHYLSIKAYLLRVERNARGEEQLPDLVYCP